MRTHGEIDWRSLLLHRLVSSRLRSNSALVQQTRATISRWRSRNGDTPAMKEWDGLLESLQVEEIIKLLRSRDERAKRLRQSSPFVGILTQRERERVMIRYEAA